MMRPDYTQTAEDHASLLILIQPIGNEIQPERFNNIHKRIVNLKQFEISKPIRKINLVYKKEYSKEENAWGTFQAHRKVFGLIHIGECDAQESNVESLKEKYFQLHNKLKSEYQDTLLNSILILLNSKEEENENKQTPPTKANSGNLDEGKKQKNGGVRMSPDGSCFFDQTIPQETSDLRVSNKINKQV